MSLIFFSTKGLALQQIWIFRLTLIALCMGKLMQWFLVAFCAEVGSITKGCYSSIDKFTFNTNEAAAYW